MTRPINDLSPNNFTEMSILYFDYFLEKRIPWKKERCEHLVEKMGHFYISYISKYQKPIYIVSIILTLIVIKYFFQAYVDGVWLLEIPSMAPEG